MLAKYFMHKCKFSKTTPYFTNVFEDAASLFWFIKIYEKKESSVEPDDVINIEKYNNPNNVIKIYSWFHWECNKTW